MIDLYYSPSPNVYKVMIALEEMALSYDIKFVDLSKGEQFDPSNVGGSIAGKVPVIRDSDGPDGNALTVMESGAILQYLAEKTGLLLPHDAVSRTVTMQWLFWQMGHLGPIGGQFWHFRNYAPRIEPDGDFAYPARRYRLMLEALFAVLERRLASASYLAGDYSIADVACFPWVNSLLPEQETHLPRLEEWYDRIAARPAVERAYDRNAKVETGYERKERQNLAYPWEGLRKHTIVG